MPLAIPLIAVPSQTVTITLNSQACRINVYVLGPTEFSHLFVDLLVNDNLIIGGVIAQNLNRIVRDAYLGFFGDLAFVDTQGNDDPVYTGLGSRWSLLYFFPADLAG